ncbi:hypothetical protein PINS_up001144 [Pythium insidiosum]|nr:hypothetical protein PINS_up001144 [Pythium insidiosum]
MQDAARAIVPTPPTGDSGGAPAKESMRVAMTNMRLRRSSAPFVIGSQRNLFGGDTMDGAALWAPQGAKTVGDAAATGTVPSIVTTAPPGAVSATEPSSRRESSLFSVQHTQQDNNEYFGLIISLQQNVQSLTAGNQREKAINGHMKKQIQALTTELLKMKEAYEEEQAKAEKMAATMKKLKAGGGEYGTYLPEIHSAAAAALALQQQTQLEVTYKRKVMCS